MSFRIIGTGMYVPSKVVTNDDLAQIVDTNDEWISKRVGVKERRISENEFASEMGLKAAQNALSDAGVKPEEVDAIFAATVSGETSSPSMSCMIQNGLRRILHGNGCQCSVFSVSVLTGDSSSIFRTA